MEREASRGETAPGPFRDLIEAFVAESRQNALAEANMARRQGALTGSDICEELKDGEAMDFELALIPMQELNISNHEDYHAREVSYDDYKSHQIAFGEVVKCYQMLRVAHSVHYGRPYSDVAIVFNDRRHDPRRIGESAKKLYDSLIKKTAPS